MDEHHITVTRTARYYTVGSSKAPREIWFVCHGYAQLARRFAKDFQPIDDGTRLIVVPEALHRFYIDAAVGKHPAEARVGASWMTREDRLIEIADNVAYLDAVAAEVLDGMQARDARVIVLGFSQGVAAASRWVALGSLTPAHTILWEGNLPPELPLADTADRFRGGVTLVAGEHDAVVRPEVMHEADARLRAHAVASVMRTFEGGHRIDPLLLREIADGLTHQTSDAPRGRTDAD